MQIAACNATPKNIQPLSIEKLPPYKAARNSAIPSPEVIRALCADCSLQLENHVAIAARDEQWQKNNGHVKGSAVCVDGQVSGEHYAQKDSRLNSPHFKNLINLFSLAMEGCDVKIR